MNDYFSSQVWLLYTEEDNPDSNNPNSALAYQDSFIRYLPELNKQTNTSHGILHFYPYQKANVLLGAKDTRLPNLNEGVQYLNDLGYPVVVRPHGGLAVVNDSGILNLALASDNAIFPLSIDQAYEQMVNLIQSILAPYNVQVEAYEIPDSYCPGKFDLVIQGKKIGGIAQRRFKSGVTTATYLSVNGNQQVRSELIKHFYTISKADSSFPQVDPSQMTTIENMIQAPLSTNSLQNQIIQYFKKQTQVTLGDYQEESLQTIYQKVYPKIIKRSQSIL